MPLSTLIIIFPFLIFGIIIILCNDWDGYTSPKPPWGYVLLLIGLSGTVWFTISATYERKVQEVHIHKIYEINDGKIIKQYVSCKDLMPLSNEINGYVDPSKEIEHTIYKSIYFGIDWLIEDKFEVIEGGNPLGTK